MKRVIWLFLLVFILHDGEELIFMEWWQDAHREEITERLGSVADKLLWTTPRFVVAVSLLFLLLWWICRKAVRALASGKHDRWFPAALAVMYLNVFTHAAQSVDFRGYTPGVASALLLMLPYTLYAHFCLMREGLLSWRTGLLVIAAGPVLFGAYLLLSVLL